MTAEHSRPHLTAVGEVLISLQAPIDSDLAGVPRDPDRPTGVMLNQRHAGERQVYCYRSGSAASALTVEQVLTGGVGPVGISGVTFAIAGGCRSGRGRGCGAGGQHSRRSRRAPVSR